MLEIRHVTKTYRPKKGVPVLALDDVSLSFGDTGLVFILGKSGSGKSTLLNVVGGLDRADDGEFVIEGKSSKEFKGGDFDSYRNTFIGFIFQEYNILNEFNVAQNVALAMELQGKKANKERLNEILEEVDLTGFGGRKPNELSGGQKQRVAIARALVKDPKIIMADEPTGALDSATGAQVFDTLKKLSKTKLVLVVSHDREFAEYYGDRVIELADGKIVSDILKYRASAEKESEGVSVVDGDILRIDGGYELTEADLGFINAYLKKRRGETIISSDPRANDGLKRAAMIDEKGSKESFRATEEASDEELGISLKDRKDAKFVRSRMPFSKAFKMGASSLKTKPVRLFFTIFLSFIALAMFGLADTLAAYNKVDNTVLSIRDNNVKTAVFAKGGYSSDVMNDVDLAKLNEETGVAFQGVFNAGVSGGSSINKPNLLNSNSIGYPGSFEKYYNSGVSGFYELEESELGGFGFERIAGRLPREDGEIAVSKYFYQCYREAGYFDSVLNVKIKKGELTADDGANGMIGKILRFNGETAFNNGSVPEVVYSDFTVVGIYDTKIPQKYDILKEANENGNIVDYMMRNEFGAVLSGGLHNAVFVNSGFVARKIAAIKAANGEMVGHILQNDAISFAKYDGNGRGRGFSANHIMKLSDVSQHEIVWMGEPADRLAADQIIVSPYILQNLVSDLRNVPYDKTAKYFDYGSVRESRYDNIESFFGNTRRIAAYREVDARGVPAAFLTDYAAEINSYYYSFYFGNGDRDQCEKEFYAHFLSNQYGTQNGYNVNPYGKCGKYIETELMVDTLKEAEFAEYFDTIFSTFEYDESYENIDGNFERHSKKANVAGIYVGDLSFLQNTHVSNSVILPDAAYAEHAKEPGYYSHAVAPMPDSAAGIRKLVTYHYDNEKIVYDSHDTAHLPLMTNEVISSFGQVNSLIETLAEVFLYVGIGLAVFSAFLLANFIAVSISNKKREIGILRAVGAKSSDVFTIFFSESFLIALINFVLALAGTIAGSIVLNNVFSDEIGMAISLLNFGIRQIALMLGVSILVSVVASFLPVWLIAKKRPIEAIRGR